MALKQKNISDYCIKKALLEIDEETYQKTLEKFFREKWSSLKGTPNRFARMKKTSAYLLQKGYEAHLINELFQSAT